MIKKLLFLTVTLLLCSVLTAAYGYWVNTLGVSLAWMIADEKQVVILGLSPSAETETMEDEEETGLFEGDVIENIEFAPVPLGDTSGATDGAPSESPSEPEVAKSGGTFADTLPLFSLLLSFISSTPMWNSRFSFSSRKSGPRWVSAAELLPYTLHINRTYRKINRRK